MRSLSREEAKSWCVDHGVSLDERGHPVRPADVKSFSIPEDAGKKVVLVAEQVGSYRSGSEVLVWFTEWGVWPRSERPHVFERFRQSYGETRPLIEIPAFLFLRSEFEDVMSFVTLGVLFLWDVFVVSGSRVLHFSHDEFGWSMGYAH
jgi:hypothetical protein